MPVSMVSEFSGEVNFMRFVFLGTMAAVAVAVVASAAEAQQSNPYDGVGNPYLLILREPAVWDDLKLTSNQRGDLTQLNARIDGPLLAMRNWSQEAANKKFVELLGETESAASTILTRDQQQRVRQIMLRVRGIECVTDDKVAETLQISSKQRESIQEIIKETRATVADLRAQAKAGKPREPLDKEYAKQQADQQKKILAEMTTRQREQLTTLIGRNFDLSQLGKVSFKAPELVAGGEWINSKPLSMAQLRGRVVAVHIWTFG